MLIWLSVPLLITIVFLFTGIYIVPQQNVFIIERFGKYHKMSGAGIHLKIPVVDRIATKVSMRVMQLNETVNTKTKDNVFCNINVAVQYKVDPNNIAASFYELSNPEMQIRAYVEDNIRNALPAITLDDAFVQKDQIARDVQNTLKSSMDNFGFVIINTLITDIDPDAAVKNAMNSINESQRRKEAARELAEADKITVVVKAEAEAEQARLHGEGIANQRKAIIDGLSQSLQELKSAEMTETEVMSIILTEQYLDVLSSLSGSPNTKVLMLPSNIDGSDQMRNAMISSLESSAAGTLAGSGPGDIELKL